MERVVLNATPAVYAQVFGLYLKIESSLNLPPRLTITEG